MFAFWIVSPLVRAVLGPGGYEAACRLWGSRGREMAKNH